MARDLCEFTREKIEELAKEIEKELREEHEESYEKETLKKLKEWYPDIFGLKYDWKVISQIIFWFIALRLHWKYTLEEAKDALGDALTISTKLEVSLPQLFDEKGKYREDLDFDASN